MPNVRRVPQVAPQRWFTSLAIALVFSTALHAESTIWVGTYDLLPDRAGQTIDLQVTSDDHVRGFNLRAQIGDGLGPEVEPVFSSVDFTESVWEPGPIMVLGGPVDGAAQFAQASVNLSDTGFTVIPNGRLVRLTIDATGLDAGEFPLRLSQTEIGEDSDFIRVGGSTFVPQITNGILRIVPEPTSGAVLAIALLYWARSSMRRSDRARA